MKLFISLLINVIFGISLQFPVYKPCNSIQGLLDVDDLAYFVVITPTIINIYDNNFNLNLKESLD